MSVVTDPKFSPFPFGSLPKLTAADAAFESAVARWLGGRTRDRGALGTLVGSPVTIVCDGVIGERAAVAPIAALAREPATFATAAASPSARREAPVDPEGPTAVDPHVPRGSVAPADLDGAFAELRVAGLRVPLVGGGLAVRAIAQRVLGGPAELAAPRPLVPVEHAIFAMLVAAACEDLGVRADVAPRLALDARELADARRVQVRATLLGGDLELAVVAHVPRALALRPPPARPVATWSEGVTFELPIVVGRCALPREVIAALAPRDVVTIEGRRDRGELVFGDGAIGLAVPAGGVEARVATGYGVRDMALPDDAHAELTVTIGTVQLSLRRLVELSVGEVVRLGRPLGGPFELRVAGKAIGTGELIDVDGELGVRVLSVGD